MSTVAHTPQELLGMEDIRDHEHQRQTDFSLLQQKAHKALAELLHDSEGVHVNLASNIGGMALNLRMLFGDLHILSVQRNPIAAKSHAELFQQHSYVRENLQQTRKYSFRGAQNGTLQRTFQLQHTELANPNFEHLAPSNWVILDELDSLIVTREILGTRRKIDSASLSFPVFHYVRTIESPYPTQRAFSGVGERMASVVQKELHGGYQFLSEKMKPGGELLLGIDSGANDPDVIINGTRILMRECSQYWEGPHYETPGKIENGNTISLMKFRRNAKEVQ